MRADRTGQGKAGAQVSAELKLRLKWAGLATMTRCPVGDKRTWAWAPPKISPSKFLSLVRVNVPPTNDSEL